MPEPTVEDAPSPNHGPRAGGARPDMVVLHYTGMEGGEEAVARLRDPGSGVSAHYVVLTDGRVLRLVPESERAWHAGVSRWGDVTDVNSRSVGIEIVNAGHDHGYHPFGERQMTALEGLLRGIVGRWSIPPERVLGHSCIAPGRKIDPGEKFDWRRLARHGLAVWMDGAPPGPLDRPPDAIDFQRAGRAFGFGVEPTGKWDGLTRDYWDAFVARFRPTEIGVAPHGAGVRHLQALAERWPVRLDASLPSA